MVLRINSARCSTGLDGVESPAFDTGESAEKRCLTARTCAEIEPASGVFTFERSNAEGAGHQLTALVLHARQALADRLELSGVTAVEMHGVRRVRPDLAAGHQC